MVIKSGDLYQEIYSRNIGFFSGAEQLSLKNITIGVAGVGGVGGFLAERLIRAGVGHIKITDNGTFEKSNLNRQLGSTMLTLGEKKAGVVYRQLKDINPTAKIEYFNGGLNTEADMESFIDGCDIVADEMDTSAYKQSILLQRACRKLGKYYLFSCALGFGALVAIFPHDGMTLEEYNGITPGTDLDKLGHMTISIEKMAPVAPSYAASIPIESAEKIMKGEAPVPSNSIGVGLTSVMTTNEIINIMVKKREIITAPRFIYIDLMDLRIVVGKIS